MADIVMKRGDTRPPLVRQFTQTLGNSTTPIDLTSATSVTFQLRVQSGSGTMLGGTCQVADAVNGVVIYTWQTADTAVVGFFEAEYQIAWSDGGIQTVPSGNQTAGADTGDFITVEFVEDVDGTAPVLR